MLHKNKELLREARKGHVHRLDRLVKDGADVNCWGKYGYTPLMEAASVGTDSRFRNVSTCMRHLLVEISEFWTRFASSFLRTWGPAPKPPGFS